MERIKIERQIMEQMVEQMVEQWQAEQFCSGFVTVAGLLRSHAEKLERLRRELAEVEIEIMDHIIGSISNRCEPSTLRLNNLRHGKEQLMEAIAAHLASQ